MLLWYFKTLSLYISCWKFGRIESLSNWKCFVQFFIEHTFCQKFGNLTPAISDFADIFLLANIVLKGGLALSIQTIRSLLKTPVNYPEK